VNSKFDHNKVLNSQMIGSSGSGIGMSHQKLNDELSKNKMYQSADKENYSLNSLEQTKVKKE
jgi:hypothetical protein